MCVCVHLLFDQVEAGAAAEEDRVVVAASEADEAAIVAATAVSRDCVVALV